MHRPFHGGIFLSSSLLSHCPYANPVPVSPPDSISNSLQSIMIKLNKKLGEVHHVSAQLALRLIDSIVIYKGNELSLWKRKNNHYDQAETVTLAQHDRYLQLKSMNHMCILITELIDQWMKKANEPETVLAELRSTYEDLSLLKKEISHYHPDDQAAQMEIINQSMNLILHMIHESVMNEKWLNLEAQYIQRIKSAYFMQIRNAAYTVRIIC